MHRQGPEDPTDRKSATIARALWALLLSALVVSVVANVGLVRAARGYFRSENAVRLDPGGLKAYARERDHRPESGRPTLVLFGDSRALMWSPPALANYDVVDRGVGNQTTAQILLRFDADVVPLHPEVVVLEAGVNDLKAIAQFPKQRGEIVADCEAHLRQIVARCRGLGAGVVLVKVFAIGDVPWWRRPFWSDDVASAVREVNSFLPTLLGDRVVLLDADAALNDARGRIRPAYQFDYLHLAPPGYAALNEQLAPLVRLLRHAP